MTFCSQLYQYIQDIYEEKNIHQSVIIVNSENLRTLYTELMSGFFPVSLLDEIEDFENINTRVLLLSSQQLEFMKYKGKKFKMSNPNDLIINLTDR